MGSIHRNFRSGRLPGPQAAWCRDEFGLIQDARDQGERGLNMQRTFRYAVLVIVAAIVSGTLPAQATVFPPEGGKGDRGEEVRCPDGHILVGFEGRTGLWIDQISLMCARLMIPGFTTQDVVVLAPPRGGIGGSREEKYCETNAGIRDINITFERITDGGLARRAYVAGVDFSCTRPADGSFKGRRRFGPGSKWPPTAQACPGSEYATGLTIRYGGHVNAVGLICSAIANWPPTSSPANTGSQPKDALGAGMEDNTDRPGWDYQRLVLGNLGVPNHCQDRCKAESDRCRAWTFVRRGVQGPSAVCYLKTAQPDAKANACCVSGLNKKVVGLGKKPPASSGDGPDAAAPDEPDAPPPSASRCLAGFVERKARPSDDVCVTEESRVVAQAENVLASSRWDPNGAYGPHTCISGFVWREAFDGDTVCVRPERRAAVKEENRLGPSRRE